MAIGGVGTYFSAGAASSGGVPLIVDGGARVIFYIPRLGGSSIY